jgi:hypothetical protein
VGDYDSDLVGLDGHAWRVFWDIGVRFWENWMHKDDFWMLSGFYDDQ